MAIENIKNIGVVGSGKAATTLVSKIWNRYQVSLYARNGAKGKNLSDSYDIHLVPEIGELSSCDLIILGVSDGAIAEVSQELKEFTGLCVHLSGTQAITQISSSRKGIMWPIQSLNGSESELKNTPFYYETLVLEDEALICSLIDSMEGLPVKSDQSLRDKMHLCAVLSNNFSNYLFTLCHDLVGSENAQHLLPILSESIRSWETHHPEDTQTGPAVRKDDKSMEKHLALLENCPNISEVYQMISKLIQERHEIL